MNEFEIGVALERLRASLRRDAKEAAPTGAPIGDDSDSDHRAEQWARSYAFVSAAMRVESIMRKMTEEKT